jgi:hypothetical protein
MERMNRNIIRLSSIRSQDDDGFVEGDPAYLFGIVRDITALVLKGEKMKP